MPSAPESVSISWRLGGQADKKRVAHTHALCLLLYDGDLAARVGGRPLAIAADTALPAVFCEAPRRAQEAVHSAVSISVIIDTAVFFI